MPIGDSYFFDIPPTTLPAQPLWLTLGSVPAGWYHVLITGTLEWNDTLLQVERIIRAAIDLDAFDAAGNLMSDFDSGIFIRVEENYVPETLEQASRFVTEQTVVEIPAGATLKVMVLDQSNSAAPPPRITRGRVSLIAVRPL